MMYPQSTFLPRARRWHQRSLSLKTKGSYNRQAARQTVGKCQRKVKNQRLDFHHKIARKLVTQYDVIFVENLKVKNMVRRAVPRPDPENPGSYLPNGAAAKTGLNRSISDAGWAAFVSVMCAKAVEAGRIIGDADPGTPPTAARSVDTQRRRTVSPRRCSNVNNAAMRPTQT